MKLPLIPAHWSWKVLSELGSPERPVVKAGPFGSSLKKEYYVESGFRVYGQEQVIAGSLSVGDYYINKEKFESLKSCEVKAGDILVSLVGTFGKILVVPEIFEAGIINPRLVRLSLNPSFVNPYFFCHFFQSPLAQHQIKLKSHGGTMDILNTKNISELLVPLPPLEEQHRIAAILDKADAIRRKRKEAIRLTEELLRSTFLEMFGDPVTNPKGWEFRQLEELLSEPLQNGAYFHKDYYVEDNTGTEMVHMSDAFYGMVKRGNLKRVNATLAEIEKYNLNSNDVIVTRRSLNYEGSAKPCLVSGDEPLIFESSLIRVSVNQKIIDHIFFFSYMSLPEARKAFVFPNVTKSTISGINQAGLHRIPIFLPPLSIQMNYRKIYEKVKLLVLRHEKTLEQSDNLFNSLLQRAFSGEL
ncbi:MAG: restriction endonuclease subunit S [Scytonematopsis contorta HA4267-MV1]|jgi:type I restriction enzyme S subunit|nr:restriction endonuclease subunit S [Scytonematopsis contorta HA4267-MV1]